MNEYRFVFVKKNGYANTITSEEKILNKHF